MSVSDSGPGPEQMVSVWRAIAASHAAVCSALERELGERHGLGVSDFEVLERLAESTDHQYRAQELADAVHLSQSALSRLISRLEKTGLVERCLCGEDRRGIYVTLTEAGRQRHAEAAPTHRDVIIGVLGGQPNVRCAMTGDATGWHAPGPSELDGDQAGRDITVLAHVVADR
ncbi:MAG TPA: MarR family transcriptional regulator [Streptosporangiaceae bacterium]